MDFSTTSGRGRVQDHELIGMEAGTKVVLLNESSALLEATNDLVTFGQIVNGITALGVCLEWKDLAIDPETAYPIFGTEVQCRQKCLGVGHAEARQLHQGVGPAHARYGRSRRRAKSDGLVSKDAAKAEADHGFRFIQVIVIYPLEAKARKPPV